MACHWASGHQQQQTLLSWRFLKYRGMSGFTANYIPFPPYFAPSRYFSSFFSSLIVAVLALLNPIPNAEYDTEFQAYSYSYICYLSFFHPEQRHLAWSYLCGAVHVSVGEYALPEQERTWTNLLAFISN